MTNYEKWQLEKYGNIVGFDKPKKELSTIEKAERLLEQLKNNNTRLLDLINEIPDGEFKNKCFDKLIDITESTQKTILYLTQ